MGGLMSKRRQRKICVDSSLPQDESDVISTISSDSDVLSTISSLGVDLGELSFESLKTVIGGLRNMDNNVLKVILESNEEMWKNDELIELVEDYFDNCFKTLDLCDALEECLKRARKNQLLILVALQHFEKSGVEATLLVELNRYKSAENPFTEEFFGIFQSVYVHQVLMLEKLQSRKKKLDKKFKHIHAWRKVIKVIFAAALAAVLICSVVAAAIAAPPVAGALAAATAIPIASMGTGIDFHLKNHEDAIKGHKELLNSIEGRTCVTIKDLGTIKLLIDKLENEIGSLLSNADFSTNEESVKICIEEIRRKVDVFAKNVDDLGVQAHICSTDIERARAVLLQRIMNH